ncbi:MAG TPA: DUF222 domain-containing protein [Nocardioidaceae bacterium]|nr:DUF222 domain-containing protein [Nocardioidaceae bacterium]
MFDHGWADQLRDTVSRAAGFDLSEASTDDLRELLIGIQRDADQLLAMHARVVAEFESRDGHRADGYASMAAWLRRVLRLSGSETRARRRAATALVDLPEVKAAAEAGRIRPSHVAVFATGLKRLGPSVMREHLDLLLPVAETCDPSDLLTVVDRLRDTVDPDAADRDWIHAQEKYDVNLRRVGHGYDLSGYLDPETGAKLKQVLDSVSAPECSEDQRPVAQRRVEGLNRLVSAILDSGLPSDKGVRPHLAVTVGLDTLQKAVRGDRISSAPPAFLAGYGLIGRDLLSRLACDATLSVVLTKTTDAAGRQPYKHVLDVGRTERLATSRQRLAILIQQGFRCAAPGCANTYLEIHHIVSWLDGGATDMDNLVGLCVGCHHLVHAGQLRCHRSTDGDVVFSTRDGAPIPDRRRRALVELERGLDPPAA